MQHIKITTKFDITHTNVVRKPKQETFPIKANGCLFKTNDEWVKARKQQSNWETLMQIVSLRTQPLNIKSYKKDNEWVLEFDIEFDEVFTKDGDDLKLLKDDCENVPMIVGLNEDRGLRPIILVGENMFLEIYNYDQL